LFCSWFFGDICSADAEELLMQPIAEHGSFLVCKSDKRLGEYSLSLRYFEEVKHCEIYRVGGNVYLSSKERFQTISELITHYSKQSLPTANNQCVTLKKIYPYASENTNLVKDWETNRDSICFVKKIGTDTLSEIWEGIWNGATSVAVKTPLNAKNIKKFLREVEILKQLSHPNVIQLYAMCTREKPIYIITELPKHGNLLEYLRGDGCSLEFPQLVNMMTQVAVGMAYLGEKNYIHRDLAARNIVVAEGLVCKVADFSSAQAISLGTYEKYAGTKLPIKWTAPEVMQSSCFTVKSDVWSFGILMYEFITHGRFPYPGMDNPQVVQALKTGYRMSCPMGCPEQLYEIMADCWKEDAASRPTFETLQCRLEEFFAEIEHTQLPSDQVKKVTVRFQ